MTRDPVREALRQANIIEACERGTWVLSLGFGKGPVAHERLIAVSDALRREALVASTPDLGGVEEAYREGWRDCVSRLQDTINHDLNVTEAWRDSRFATPSPVDDRGEPHDNR